MTNNGLRTVLHSWATPEVNRQQRAAAELNSTSGENAQAQWWSITLLLRRGGRVNSSHITRPHLPTQHCHEYVFTLFNWLLFLLRGSTQLCCHFSYKCTFFVNFLRNISAKRMRHLLFFLLQRDKTGKN